MNLNESAKVPGDAPPPVTGESSSRGQIYLWHGGSLWIGSHTGATSRHDHHAIQLTFAISGAFALQLDAGGQWHPYQAALIPPHCPHALAGYDVVSGTVFVEPESAAGRMLLDRFGSDRVVALPEDLGRKSAETLRVPFETDPIEQRMISAAWDVVGLLTEGVRPRAAADERVLRAIELVRERIDGPIAQNEIAEAVYLSPSRFRHVFAAETGMAFRPYVLWLRLHRALEVYTRGEKLTNAAHAAGFADLAHLSRTFRRMFGIVPTNLQRDERLLVATERSWESAPAAKRF